MSKALTVILIIFGAIFFFPVAIGLIGAIVGIVVGIFGAIIGIIAALFGITIAVPVAIFDFLFGGFTFATGVAILPGILFLILIASLVFALSRRRTVSK